MMSSKKRDAVAAIAVAVPLLIAAAGVAGGRVRADDGASRDVIITVPVNTVVHGSAGSVHLVAEQSIPTALVGATCPGTVAATNQRSEHPNSDLIITTGTESVTVPDVEAEAFASRVIDFTFTLGATVAVEVRLGPDGIFSGGLDVVLNCPAPPTTTVAPTTTTVAPTTTLTTTTDAATTTDAPTTTAAAAATTSTTIQAASQGATTSAPSVLPAGATLPPTGSSMSPTLIFALLFTVVGAASIIVRTRTS